MKLTAVGYLKKSVYCSNAKHRLFSYFPAIFWGSRCLSLRPASGRRAGDEGLSGLYRVVLGLTPAAGLTTLGNSLSDSLGFLFSDGPTPQESTSCEEHSPSYAGASQCGSGF